jgi:hypothetical protein
VCPDDDDARAPRLQRTTASPFPPECAHEKKKRMRTPAVPTKKKHQVTLHDCAKVVSVLCTYFHLYTSSPPLTPSVRVCCRIAGVEPELLLLQRVARGE